MAKRRRSSEALPAPKKHRAELHDRLSDLSDELLIRILHHLPIETLLLCQTLSHHFYHLAGDSELWKSLYYDRFVLPRVLRIPGLRVPPQFSSRKSRWLDDSGLLHRDRKTNWKKQYKLRHNWAIGACEIQEIPVKDGPSGPSVPEMLIRLAEGLVFTADKEGLRVWDLKGKSLITGCELQGIPTCLAVEQEAGAEVGVALGFEDGSWEIWRLAERRLKVIYRHPPGMGMLSAVAYSKPYILTITDSQVLSLYTFAPVEERGKEDGFSPRLLASLRSHTSWPPLSLSIRMTASTIIASIAYSLPTYLSGYTIGVQELHLSRTTGTTTFSRLASALPQGFSSIHTSPSTSSSGSSTPTDRSPSNTPTSLSYSHPYILATHPDNTLTLYLCTSTASSLTITPGTKLWGHTSSVSSAEITPRGKAVSVSTRGNELRVWELEGGGLSTQSRKRRNTTAMMTDQSVRIRTEDGDAADGGWEMATTRRRERWQEETLASKRWVGFDDEMVIVLKEDARGNQALMIYDFT